LDQEEGSREGKGLVFLDWKEQGQEEEMELQPSWSQDQQSQSWAKLPGEDVS